METVNPVRRRVALLAAAAPFAHAVIGALGAVIGAPRDALAVSAPPGPNTVIIDNFSFTPATLTVTAGTTVVWLNHDDIPHTIVSDASPRVFKSSPLDTDDQFSYTFSQAGTFKYFCSIHSHMTGTVIVK